MKQSAIRRSQLFNQRSYRRIQHVPRMSGVGGIAMQTGFWTTLPETLTVAHCNERNLK